MNTELETILDLCIDRLREGQTPEECLQAFPDHAEALRPLLETAAVLKDLPREEPSDDMISAALLDVGRRSREPEQTQTKAKGFLPPVFHSPYLKAALNTLLIVILLFWGLSTVSADSIPGDVFYPVKRFTEQVRFALTLGPEGKAELKLTFSEQRLRELSAYYRETGQVDTSLIRTMLKEAQLALDKYAQSEQGPSYLVTRAQQVNTTQQEYLQQIQPHVNPGAQQTIDRAIRTCAQRRERMQQMMNGMMQQQGPMHRRMMNGRMRRMMQDRQ